MLASGAASVINHLLRGEQWARSRLKRHAGKTARVHISPLGFDFTVLEDGEIEEAGSSQVSPDVLIELTPALALRYLARDEAAARETKVTGDSDFAADLNFVAANLRYDVEEDLSRVFGDVIAHRVTQAGSQFLAWQKQTFNNVTQAASEYWTHERPLIATRRQVEEFVREVDAVRDHVERLEKRLDRLALQTRPNQP